MEWCGGVETMEGILSRIYQREEAAVKRERAMAYAFSHQVNYEITCLVFSPRNWSFSHPWVSHWLQWRANPGVNLGQPYEIGNGNWGWSWMERWIAARPWEFRISSLQKTQSKAAVKAIKKGNPSIISALSSNKPPVSAIRIPPKKLPLLARLADEKAIKQEQNPAAVTTQTCEVVWVNQSSTFNVLSVVNNDR